MEIGGYLEFERFHGNEYHTNCIKLNTARNCLKYLIEAKGIKKLWLSRWNCSSVLKTCFDSGIQIGFFDLDSNLAPIMPPDYHSSDYVYVVNYYGQVSTVSFEHMIIDNVQAFFQKPINGVDTLYTCRKYFGVTDGAYLYTDRKIERELEQDFSWKRLKYLAGRLEVSGSDFYNSYHTNEEILDSLPLMRMSVFTENIMKSIDYEYIKHKREDNFRYLHTKLQTYNQFQIKYVDGPFAYPLMIDEGEKLRKYLQKEKIYVAKLWPNVQECKESFFAENILPIPCDQRYSISEMDIISKLIIKYYGGSN